jgi:ADP-ribosylglycohydrolase
MMRALVESLVEGERVDPADIADRFVSLWRDQEIVGHGQTSAQAIRRLMAGVPWTESGTPTLRPSNGSAMRTAPLGLWHHDDPAALAEAAADVSRITHADPRCLAGAVAVSAAVAWNLHHETFDPVGLTNWTAKLARPFDSTTADRILQLADWRAEAPQVVATKIGSEGLPAEWQPRKYKESLAWPGIAPFVTATVLIALYAFMRTPDDWVESVCWVIALGGDVDTTAAITGAISGAFNGIAAIPTELAEQVNDRGRFDYDYLNCLAERLWKLRAS